MCDNRMTIGIILDSKLNFISHIEHVAKSSNKMLGFIKRMAKGFKRIQSFKTLYNALVLSRLEYGCQIWNPSYQVHIDRLERVQRSFTRFLAFKSSNSNINTRCSYEDRLSYFKMHSLKHRRDYHDLNCLHKLLSGTMSEPNLLMEINFTVPKHNHRKCRETKTFTPSFSRTQLGKFSPINRFERCYNELESKYNLDIYNDSPIVWKKKLLQP
ncbi:hypothetical protein JYU34_021716 [Plutella xylostella]|uniref:Uncharacterized protein n=1 Tax=Plutella xylostella TaxID=51655 RepID=A0ABQ7PRJ0_PLUXY|nr:hypothetical protein JYU34_021716 [Plutella xylostella]